MTFKFSKFHERTIEERKELIFSTSRLKKEEQQLFENEQYDQLSDQLVENAFGVMEIPLGAAVNFVVNGQERIIPMATEESQ
ncbi:hydroxymethylglutaryl-CoA reductase [Geomicrobium sp. JCM 19037]|nr:hydroxymethylglutaryl-CoA reductase [Geomicrobium sp. JCM 19037]